MTTLALILTTLALPALTLLVLSLASAFRDDERQYPQREADHVG